jgi:hypothetical protein
MSYPHNLRVYADLEHPSQWGIDDRTGFLEFLSNLPFQWDQRGNSVQNLRLRIAPEYQDKVATILKPVIIVGPEGVGLPDPRPTNYAAKMASTGPELPFAPSNPMLPVVEPIEGAPITGEAPQFYQKGGPGI